ncbi:MAG: chromosome segregation protein SMC [Clostridia bacterium]|nr:chromosome segregation protein SMC [Clostridia bacterium]
MILKALEIQGFKSFPDKTVLSFGQGITAVVGPNGSGKSNISDAIRWVLGEQSAKNLRGSKMENVIFDGTAARRGMGFAEVSLIIDNTTRTLDFDGDEVKVTRRYYRSGDSEYLLNNATVRLKDIQMLFMDTGLGRDGYSIIGQGQIGDIVASKSQERREIFEEAAGIAKYRYRKSEAERRLKATEDNLLRLRDIVAQLEARVGPLKTQSEKAKKFLEYSGEKKQLEIGLWLHTIERSHTILRELSDALEMARAQYDAAGNEIGRIEQQMDKAVSETEQLLVRIDDVRRQIHLLEEQAALLDSQAAVRSNDRHHNDESIERITGEIRASLEGAQAIDAEKEEKLRQIAAKQAEIDALHERQLALSEEAEALVRSTDDVSGRMESLAKEAALLADRLSDQRVRSVTSESALAEIEQRLETLKAEIAALEQEKQDAEKSLADCETGLQTCRETVTSLQNAASGLELRLQNRTQKWQDAQKAADTLRLDHETALRRIRLLEEMERSMEGFQNSVKAVIKQAQRGALRGIKGTVSQLIDTKGDYALAIETALGSSAQNIVCETESDAKRGIAFLKETKGGRATFLPLDTIKGRVLEEKELDSEDGFIGLASDLVTCDKAYREIVCDLLGRTVVAEDLDAAVRIARRYRYHFRVVSLDGQVVNAGGSMTGGSSVKSAGLLSRRSEIERLTEECEAIKGRMQTAQEALQTAEQDMTAVRAELSGTTAELTTAQEDVIRFEAEQRRLDELCKAVIRSIEERERETAGLVERAADHRRTIREAAEQSDALLEEQKKLNDMIEELSGGRVELQSKREALAAQTADCKLQAAKLGAEIDSLRVSLVELDTRRSDAEGYRARLQEQIDSLRQDSEKIDSEIVVLTENAADLRQKAVDSEEEIRRLTEERMQLEASQTVLRQSSRDKSSERELAGQEIARLEEKQAAANRQVEEIESRLQDEYNMTRMQAAAEAIPIDDIAAASKRLQELKNKIRALGSVNVDAIEEFKEVNEQYAFLSTQVNDVEISKKELLALIDELTGQMQTMFVERFNQINVKFGAVFEELFEGGKAALSLTDPDDVLNSGIDMHVQPPGKKILHLDALSGGEKALVAISLLFAILHVTPSPFCVLDEIEAALDDTNVDRYAAYLRRMCDRTQFIVITHRRGTMEEADVLYGVTMQEKGVSKLLELRVGELEEKLGIDAVDHPAT